MWDTKCSGDKWIKNLVPKVMSKHMAPVERHKFFLSQAGTGHRAFRVYLYKIGMQTISNYPCGKADQTPEHVFRACEWCAEGRSAD